MKLKSKHSKFTLELLQQQLSTSYYVTFNVVSFQRSYRKFFKFSNWHDGTFSMHSKSTGHGCVITVSANNYFEVGYSTTNIKYSLNCLSNRELLEKLLKHNLFDPKSNHN